MRKLAALVLLALACAIDYQHDGERSCATWSCAYWDGLRCILPVVVAQDDPEAGVPQSAPPDVP